MRVITVTGYLARDPEVRQAKNGNPFVCFVLASNEGKDAPTMWFNITLFDDPFGIAQYLHKGSYIIVSGNYSIREYTRQDNSVGVSHDIRANGVYFVNNGPKQDSQNTQQVQNNQQIQSTQQMQPSQQYQQQMNYGTQPNVQTTQMVSPQPMAQPMTQTFQPQAAQTMQPQTVQPMQTQMPQNMSAPNTMGGMSQPVTMQMPTSGVPNILNGENNDDIPF